MPDSLVDISTLASVMVGFDGVGSLFVFASMPAPLSDSIEALGLDPDVVADPADLLFPSITERSWDSETGVSCWYAISQSHQE